MSALEQTATAAGGAVETSASDLYHRHRRRLVGFCFAQLRSRDEAEDAVQDTFIYALHALRRGVVPESELAWLFTIARNVCQTRRRNGSRRSQVVVTRDLDALHDVLPAREEHGEELYGLSQALASIPDTQRHAILLREWQGLSYREIARELELSQAAVETLLFRARRSLARALDNSGKAVARALNLPAVIGLARSLLGGGAAKIAAGTIAVAATSAVGAATLSPFADPGPPRSAAAAVPALAARPEPVVAGTPVVSRPPGVARRGDVVREAVGKKLRPAAARRRPGSIAEVAVDSARREPAAPASGGSPAPSVRPPAGRAPEPATRSAPSTPSVQPTALPALQPVTPSSQQPLPAVPLPPVAPLGEPLPREVPSLPVTVPVPVPVPDVTIPTPPAATIPQPFLP